jgi:REP element-mobilizing transposase RayT
MTGYRRNFVAGGSFFFTVNLADRRLQLLTENIDALRTAFRETQRHHSFTIDAIVVLPDHLHTVWTLPEGDADFSTRWRLIKTSFSHKLAAGEPISQAVVSAKANAVSGSDAIGSTRFATRSIFRVTSTTFTLTLSNMGL